MGPTTNTPSRDSPSLQRSLGFVAEDGRGRSWRRCPSGRHFNGASASLPRMVARDAGNALFQLTLQRNLGFVAEDGSSTSVSRGASGTNFNGASASLPRMEAGREEEQRQADQLQRSLGFVAEDGSCVKRWSRAARWHFNGASASLPRMETCEVLARALADHTSTEPRLRCRGWCKETSAEPEMSK